MTPLTVYTAASFRLLHAVRLFHDALRARIPDVQILDWTDKATPPPGLPPEQRRHWFDTERQGGQVFEFCRDACGQADLVIYLGESGQDAGVEVGFAAASGTPILGVCGPLEAPGLMLHGAVTRWCCDVDTAVNLIARLSACRYDDTECRDCDCFDLCPYQTPDPSAGRSSSCL